MIRFRYIFPLAIFFTPFFLNASSREVLEVSNSVPLASTHIVVPEPKFSIADQELLVGLKAHLGGSNTSGLKKKIKLTSEDKLIEILDSQGLVHRAREISIGWKEITLPTSTKFARQVLGPYASYESASRIAAAIQKLGIRSHIAHPFDWEVWISHDAILPDDFKTKLVYQTKLSQVQPTLKLKSGEYLLSGPIQISAPSGLRFQGGWYSGPFLLKPDAYGSWTFIEKVSLEKYLLGVVPHEIGASSPLSALAAQAVLARTWALANKNRFKIDGYHLCSDTQCQVYKNTKEVNQNVADAITQTSGKILTWKGHPIHAVYHATNGGIKASANEAWAMSEIPYLTSALDGSSRWEKKFPISFTNDQEIRRFLAERDGAFGNNHYLFRWKRTLSAEQISTFLGKANKSLKSPMNIKVLSRGPSGRVLSLIISDQQDTLTVTLERDQIRRILKNIPSTLFVIDKVGDKKWLFTGGGFGHGAGLSQAGAIDLGHRGWSTKRILTYYYPGTTYESLQ